MKKILLLLISVSTLVTVAQNNQTVPEPEFINQVYSLDKASNSLIRLERLTAEAKGKAKAFGYGGSKVVYQVKGKTSTIQLDAASISFVVKLGENSSEPTSWFPLYKAESKGSKREATYSESNVLGSDKNASIVRLDIKKLPNNVYQMVPATTLEKGEYFFINMLTSPKPDVFCFTIK